MAMNADEARNARRRLQSRDNQRRYRQQYRDCIENLENQVKTLQIMIARCDGQIFRLRKALCWHEPQEKVVLEFYRHFKHSSYSAIPFQAQKQTEFINNVMHPNIMFMEQRGIEKVFEQCSLYHTLFHSFELTCKAIDVMNLDDKIVVRTPAEIHLRISRRTIEALFPHLLSDESTVQKLIGRVLRMPMLLHFHFDDCGVIEALDTFADVTVHIVELLKDISGELMVISDIRINHNAELQASNIEVCEL